VSTATPGPSATPGPAAKTPGPTGGAVVTGPAAALPLLARRRAAALMARDVLMLATAEAPGSPASRADMGLIERLTARNARLDGVDYRLEEVRLQHWAGSGAVVQARITTEAYRQVLDAGARVAQVPSGPSEGVNVLLVPTAGAPGWLIQEIDPA